MTTPATPTTSDAAAAGSPALGAQPDRTASAAPAASGEPAVETAAADVASEPSVATFQDEDGRVHYASPHAPATRKKVQAGEWEPVNVDDRFDPTTERVRDVLAYLRKHATDDAEVARVKDAEAAGEDRPTIAAWQPGQ